MPYIDLAGLSRYASRQKERLERDYALLRDMQWTRSEKAGAVSLWPAGGTPLKPVVDFLFSETPPAEGDKSPSNPSTISGVSEVNIRQLGANLAFSASVYRFSSLGDGFYGATIDNTTGSVNLSGRILYLSNQNLSFIERDKNYCCVIEYQNCDQFSLGNTVGDPLFTTENGTVSLSGTGIQKINLVVRNVANPTYALRVATDVPIGVSRTFKFRVAILQCTADEVDLNTYQYDSANNLYTLPLSGTYYGGTLDAASGVMTVTHRMFTITGTTAMSTTGYAEGTDAYRIGYYLPDKERTPVGVAVPPGYACDILPMVMNPTPSGSLCWGLASASTACYIRFPKELIGAGDDLPLGTVRPLAQAWLAQHPVTVAYPMVETNYQIVQLDPVSISALAQADKYTPRLNTVYTDAQAVQVGYIKSPIREEYELQQAVIAQGGNV